MVDPLKLFWVITNSTYLGTFFSSVPREGSEIFERKKTVERILPEHYTAKTGGCRRENFFTVSFRRNFRKSRNDPCLEKFEGRWFVSRHARRPPLSSPRPSNQERSKNANPDTREMTRAFGTMKIPIVSFREDGGVIIYKGRIVRIVYSQFERNNCEPMSFPFNRKSIRFDNYGAAPSAARYRRHTPLARPLFPFLLLLLFHRETRGPRVGFVRNVSIDAIQRVTENIFGRKWGRIGEI